MHREDNPQSSCRLQAPPPVTIPFLPVVGVWKKLPFSPLSSLDALRAIPHRRAEASRLLSNLDGQMRLNLFSELHRPGVLAACGVQVIGVNMDAIERGEAREGG
jgi:hypothetical protein